MSITETFLQSAEKEFRRYKLLGDKTFTRLSEEDIHWRLNEESNSIAVIVKHMAGNMLSRFTNFLSEDGEKEWRNRDDEFVDSFNTKQEMIDAWEKGWSCVFDALNTITAADFDTHVYIRGEKHSIYEAINRQLGHYAYHCGQLVMIGKNILGSNWDSLSIPKGGSDEFNRLMFGK